LAALEEEEKPFSSMQKLARSTHIPRTTVYRKTACLGGPRLHA
jgi:DNA-binding phage protein